MFREAGHEVRTVRDEGLQGEPDRQIYEICHEEQRCLITLDLDFADVTRFPPENIGGIAVIRVPRAPSLSLLEGLARQFLAALENMSVVRQLWIVEVGAIRVHQSDVSDFEGEETN